MTFAQPYFLYCFGPLLLLAVLLYIWARRKQAALARVGAPELVARLSATINHTGRRWQTALWLAAVALLILAMARPRWGSQVEYVERRGVEIMVVLDISESMLAEDIAPNRLARAKLEISELMERLEGNEIGLVLFSGAAFVQFPLTSDFATARSFLDAAYPGLISRPGTVIGEAIRIAMTGFNEERAAQKVIILLTDGENHEGETLTAAQEAADAGMMIFAVGFGSEKGEPIPVYDHNGDLVTYKKDAHGQTVLTRLNEATLQEIAGLTRGRYYRADAAGTEVDSLIQAIGRLQTSELESRFEARGIERFQWFVGLAIAALVMIEFIPDRIIPKPKGEA
jgi:Ca-activated chloride channel family protein